MQIASIHSHCTDMTFEMFRRPSNKCGVSESFAPPQTMYSEVSRVPQAYESASYFGFLSRENTSSLHVRYPGRFCLGEIWSNLMWPGDNGVYVDGSSCDMLHIFVQGIQAREGSENISWVTKAEKVSFVPWRERCVKSRHDSPCGRKLASFVAEEGPAIGPGLCCIETSDCKVGINLRRFLLLHTHILM